MTTATNRPSLFHNPWLRRLAWALAVLLLTWLLAWTIVPPVLKSQLVKLASAELGRGLTVGQIDFKPWTLELTLRDLAIATRDGASAQLAVQRIYVDAELESLLRLAPVVQALEVDAPALRLRRTGQGSYDIDDMLARFAAAPPASDSKPAQFALFNLAVRNGSVELDDQPVARQHALRELNLSLPFLSNLASRREITVTPALSFALNGAAFESKAASTPFAASRKTDARLQIVSMDLKPYLPYIPRSVPVQLRQAQLSADLALQFAQLDRPQLIVTGQLQLAGLDMADSAGDALLALDRVTVALDELRPLEQSIRIGKVEIQSPRLQARRDAAGRLNLALGAGAGASDTPPPAASPSAATSSAATPSAASPSAAAPSGGQAAPTAWTAAVARLELRDGTVQWRDAAITPGAHLQVDALTLDVDDLVWPMARAASFKGSLAVAPVSAPGAAAAPAPGGAASTAATVAFEGSATDRQATARLAVSNARLELAAPYVAQFLEPGLRGQLDADMELRWAEPGLQLSVASLTLDRLALVNQGSAKQVGLPQIRSLALSSASLDLEQRLLKIGKLEIVQPELAVSRGVDKRWMFEPWLKKPATGAPVAVPSDSGSAVPAWQGQLEHLLLRDAAVRLDDSAQSRPVRLAVSALNLDLRTIAFDGKRPMPAQLSARIATGQGQAGKVDYRGTLQLEPLQTRGKLLAEQLPVHALEPYFAAGLNIELLRADAGFKGDVAFTATPRGPLLRLQGDTVLEDFRANSLAGGGDGPAAAQELLNWKALGVRGLDLALEPGKPLRLEVRETTLSDFFARVIVHETGRINLQDLVRSDAPPTAADGAVAGAANAPASAAGATTSTSAAPAPAPAAGTQAQAAIVAAADPLAPQIKIGPISLVQGKVHFSDRFVKPNYSANLSELTGKLSAFSSASASAAAATPGAPPAPPAMADLELRGRAEGTASLEILGKINPLADPLALDIKGIVRDLELPPLSPYAIKYAGHGIERGKLSVDVAYQILPNGQLTASNQVVLNQLTFGDKVDGAPNSLPVKLAVALLADRNGVIDINLPISGSLSDPQFRLWPLIFKVIVNLIGKALTAPFTLLASAFGGGGDELSQVAFAPGSARLQPGAQAGLEKVAKALTDRPALKMTVVGTASLEAEREDYKRARLQALLQAEKRRVQVTAGQTPVASGDGQAATALEPAERAELLAQLFARSDIAKPRDLAGKPKELTPADMEALLLANIAADEESMRELALQRGVAVKDYLASRQLPVERLFLGAAKLADADAKWSPRAELSLGTN